MSVERLAVVLHHSRARGTAKLILIGIANHDGDGGSWPALSTLAKYANVDIRSARRAVRDLEELGEVATEARGGGHIGLPEHARPNRYSVLVECPPSCDRSTAHRELEESTPRTPVSGGPPDASVRGLRTPVSGAPRTPVSAKPSFEPSVEPSTPSRTSEDTLPIEVVTPRGATACSTEPDTTKSTKTLDEQFDDFWAAYPKRVAKIAARKAWDSARRTTDPAVILAGARRYAAGPLPEPRKFIPHPATWLARGSWEDEAEPPAQPDRPRVPGEAGWDQVYGRREPAPPPPGSGTWNLPPTRAPRADPCDRRLMNDRQINDCVLNHPQCKASA